MVEPDRDRSVLFGHGSRYAHGPVKRPNFEAYERRVRPDWPALIFATSVEHARIVAALLNRKGIRARAISGDTETATRRRVVEEFRSRRLAKYSTVTAVTVTAIARS